MPRVKNPETRENILKAARMHFSKNGYHQTNVSDIITEVGMSQGSFYNYFKNKRDIFCEILETFISDIMLIREKYPLEAIGDRLDYIDMVYKMSDYLTELFLIDKNLTRIFFWEAVGIDPELDSILDHAYHDLTSYCQGYIEKGQQLKMVTEGIDTHVVAAATIGMCTHLVNRYLRGDFGQIDRSVIVKNILNIQLKGILDDKFRSEFSL